MKIVKCSFMGSFVVIAGCAISFYPKYKATPEAEHAKVIYSIYSPDKLKTNIPGGENVCKDSKAYTFPQILGKGEFDINQYMRAKGVQTREMEMDAGSQYTYIVSYRTQATGYITVTTTCKALFTFTPKKEAEYYVWSERLENGCRINVNETIDGATRELVSEYPHIKPCSI